MAETGRTMSIVIPASNEAKLLPISLGALLQSEHPGIAVEIVVVANGSRDGTADVARSFNKDVADKGWGLVVLDLKQGGKLGALNAGDQAALGDLRVYMDADVTVSPRLLSGLATVLDRPEAAYASGRIRIRADGVASGAYARLWARVPYMSQGVPGCGLFAVNGPGRARWGEWPRIIADDTFARLHFAPSERHLVPEPYDWPIAEGFSALVKVRRRQDRGTAEVAERYPHLLANDDKPPVKCRLLAGWVIKDPIGLAAYAGVALAVRARRADSTWSRGR